MAKINLTDDEKMQIIEAINQNTEPSPDMMAKLFPGLAEKFDVAKLDRAKVATLEYAGKRSESVILSQTLLTEGGSPLQVERCFDGGKLAEQTQLDLFEQSQKKDSEWRNLIVQGDNLQFLKTCYLNQDPLIKDKVKGKVKLVYIDPPFATKSDFAATEGEKSYRDKIVTSEFIENLRERLIYIREILAEDGSIYAHLDQKMCHYMKVAMDEVFGKGNLKNEIIWEYQGAWAETPNYFPKRHQLIYFYVINQNYLFNRLHEEDINTGINFNRWYDYVDNNKIYAKNAPYHDKRFVPYVNKFKREYDRQPSGNDVIINFKGSVVGSVWYIKTVDPKSPENVKYPTQKPEKLLERIINSSSQRCDLIIDLFAGSGTTAAVAEKLGRRWIMCDFGKHALYTMQKRLLNIADSKKLGPDAKKNEKYSNQPKPFCVVSAGAYDFSRIMNLRENKEAYINFVLGLFQLNRDQKDLNGKYKLTNIYGEKDGDPVEVYPVWEDEYLREVRIDENYLKETIIQSGGKLKGNYYIITPETCTVVSDTTMKNNAGDEVHFKLLKFPYKILEDVARNFQIHDQPTSQENVNELINSTGFYFNNDVELELEKTKDDLRITKFKTRILDQKGNYYEGLDGLAMLLIDVDYNGELFDMEKTVFAKNLDENGSVKVSGLTDSIAVIAIDKHGNESKPFIIQD